MRSGETRRVRERKQGRKRDHGGPRGPLILGLCSQNRSRNTRSSKARTATRVKEPRQKDEKHKVVVRCIGGPQYSGSQGGCSLPVRATSAHSIPRSSSPFFRDHSHHDILLSSFFSLSPSLYTPPFSLFSLCFLGRLFSKSFLS